MRLLQSNTSVHQEKMHETLRLQLLVYLLSQEHPAIEVLVQVNLKSMKFQSKRRIVYISPTFAEKLIYSDGILCIHHWRAPVTPYPPFFHVICKQIVQLSALPVSMLSNLDEKIWDQTTQFSG